MSTVWLVSIGGRKECPTWKSEWHPLAQCCTGRYEPALADTVHCFDTYEEARVWCRDVVGVPIHASAESCGQYFNSAACARMGRVEYCHDNVKVQEVTPEEAKDRMKHRLADGRHDPACAAKCAALEQAAQEAEERRREQKAQRMVENNKADAKEREERARLAKIERKKETIGKVFASVFLLVLGWILFAGIDWATDWHGNRASFVVYLSPGSKWTYKLAYGMGASDVTVHIEPMPSDCNFFHAPLGSKGCHYERQISLLRYLRSATGQIPLGSHDGGKTWEWGAEVPAAGTWRIDVTWQRVRD